MDEALLPHLSPLGWEHIHQTGDYVWHTNRGVAKGRYWPPRIPNLAIFRPWRAKKSICCGVIGFFGFCQYAGAEDAAVRKCPAANPMASALLAIAHLPCVARSPDDGAGVDGKDHTSRSAAIFSTASWNFGC
jgi:hypothetical protein